MGRQSIGKNISRRRVLRIVATAGVAAALPGKAFTKPLGPVSWRGTALGADAAITLYHPDPEKANRLVSGCVAEVRRLESIFNLYDKGSDLSRLNREGHLRNPPAELAALLIESQRLGAWTGGAFDITVQPLWQLYRDHFSQSRTDTAGPSVGEIDRARRLVDYRAIRVSGDEIQFDDPNMAITLNGIAQGFITDRVTDRLKAGGVDRVLVDMGELRALGQHPDGRPWRVGLKDPVSPGDFSQIIDLDDRAVASSGGYGTRFGVHGKHHHLFDPRTGTSSDHHAGVTVLAPSAILADGLSTGMSALPVDRIRGLLAGQTDISALITDQKGTVLALPS
jgi:FAD:protein FMN transferase